jgi:RNA polymerase sigma factor (sigma-70 family)
VYSYVISNNGSKVEAKDIYQDAIIAFYENVRDGKFTGERSTISTYVYAIAKFKWLNQLKRKGVITEFHQKIELPNDFIESPLSELIHKEQKDLVLDVLAKLGATCKSLLVESIYHNKTMKEIVAETSFSNEQIARNKKYKCMKQLKKLIAENPHLIKILKFNG